MKLPNDDVSGRCFSVCAPLFHLFDFLPRIFCIRFVQNRSDGEISSCLAGERNIRETARAVPTHELYIKIRQGGVKESHVCPERVKCSVVVSLRRVRAGFIIAADDAILRETHRVSKVTAPVERDGNGDEVRRIFSVGTRKFSLRRLKRYVPSHNVA